MTAALLASWLAAAAPSHAVALSSASVSGPGDLVGESAAASEDHRRLAVFPERLIYDVSWGPLHVGQATLEASELVDFAGRAAYHLVSRAASNKFCDAFYKVRDLNESWLDARTLGSLGYSKKLREGHFFRDEWVLYDQEAGRFLGKSIGRDGSFNWHGGTVPAGVQDVLSSLYFVRSQALAPGGRIILDVNTKENWPLVVRVLKREQVRTPAGTFRTILVEPGIREEGIFIQKGKRLRVWLTDDERRVPVLMKVEVFFGHVTARLAKML